MKDKICLVTGANSGVGKETTRALYAMGATVIMVCRNGNKALTAKMEIEAGVDPAHAGKLDVVLGDLAQMDQVRRVAHEVAGRYHRLDVLINNAGAIMPRRQTTDDGFEQTFALNHLAPYVLTLRLLPLLRRSAEPRVVVVASEAHRYARFNAEALAQPTRFESMRTYAASKLANVLFTRALAQRLADEHITVNALHPGFVASNFGGQFQGFYRLLLTGLQPFAISSRAGAQTSIYLACSPKVAGITGKYFDKKRVKKPSDDALSDYYAERLWTLSEQLTGEHLEPSATPHTPQEAKTFHLPDAPAAAEPPADSENAKPEAADASSPVGAPPPDKTFGKTEDKDGAANASSPDETFGKSEDKPKAADASPVGAPPPDKTFGKSEDKDGAADASSPDKTFGKPEDKPKAADASPVGAPPPDKTFGKKDDPETRQSAGQKP